MMSLIATARHVPEPRERTLSMTQRELYRAIAEAVRDSHELLGVGDHDSLSTLGDVPTATRWLDAAIAASGEAVRSGLRGVQLTRGVESLTRLHALRVRLADVRTSRAVAGQAAVRAALGRLRGAATIEQLFRLVPEELCRCGFERAWIACLEESEWRLVGCHVAADETAGAAIVLAAPAARELTRGSYESELVRLRTTTLVSDAAGDERVDPVIAELLAPRSYVAAPLLVDTRVVGFVHADRGGAARRVDAEDRDLLALFAEAVGHVLQRAELTERLDGLRCDVRRLTQSIGDTVDDACWRGMRMAPRRPPIAVAGQAPRSRPDSLAPSAAGTSRLSSLLTSREIEVLRLMAAGETNAGIAAQLVITEGTVKSHVKRILRKLHATNRAQAVSRFFRIVQAGNAGEHGT